MIDGTFLALAPMRIGTIVTYAGSLVAFAFGTTIALVAEGPDMYAGLIVAISGLVAALTPSVRAYFADRAEQRKTSLARHYLREKLDAALWEIIELKRLIAENSQRIVANRHEAEGAKLAVGDQVRAARHEVEGRVREVEEQVARLTADIPDDNGNGDKDAK